MYADGPGLGPRAQHRLNGYSSSAAHWLPPLVRTDSLTQPPHDWAGSKGRGDAALAKEALPPRGEDTLVLVCGTDGFVDTWSGAIERVKGADGKKQKVQGPLRGILKQAGFTEDMVFKY